MSGVGDLRPADLRVTVDRNAGRYAEAISLAKHVIAGFARSVQLGSHSASCSLLRTPDLIEAGVRNTLKQNLVDLCVVEKRGIQIALYTFTPDLVFGDIAVGDVKYKVTGDWIRSDLYQSVTFAEAFGVQRAVIVCFNENSDSSPRNPIKVGQQLVVQVAWNCDPNVGPASAAQSMLQEVREVLIAKGVEEL